MQLGGLSEWKKKSYLDLWQHEQTAGNTGNVADKLISETE